MTDPSPLLATSADALSLMFEGDPLDLTDAKLMQMVTEIRRRRSDFASREAATAAAGKAKRTKAEPQSAPAAAALDKPVSEIDLDDLS
jgi:hypothetical protein